MSSQFVSRLGGLGASLCVFLLSHVLSHAAVLTAGPGEAGLRSAVQQTADGDTVVITNWVELTSTLRITNRITLRSIDPERDGILGAFDGSLIEITAPEVVLDSILFGGSPQTDGFVFRQDIVIRNCVIHRFRTPLISEFPFDPTVTVRMNGSFVENNLSPFECWNLFATNSTFKGNAGGGVGAWIAEVEGCIFEKNFGDGFSLVFGNARNCVFRYNTGLGFRFDPDPGVASLFGCLFYANSGGGLFIGEQATMTLDNCTFTRHTGLATIMMSQADDVLLRHCTIVDNLVVESDAAPWFPSSTSIAIHSAYRVELQNCLVANNPSSDDPGASGVPDANWIDGGGNVIGGSPLLSPLRDNGGPTLTMLPLPGSPAIDAAQAGDLVTDARGLSRQAGSAPDAGAVESSAGPVVDADNDGIPDSWEQFRSLNPANALDAASDTDGDGQTALQEFQSGTDPGNPASLLSFSSVEFIPAPLQQPEDRRMNITWPMSVGVSYQLEISTNLHDWQPVFGPYYPSSRYNGSQTLRYEAPASAPQGFYRLKATREGERPREPHLN